MSLNLGYVDIGAKTHVSVYHTPRHAVRVYEIDLFLPWCDGHAYKITYLVFSSATRTLILISARQPSHKELVCFAQRVEVTADDSVLFFSRIYFAILLGQED
jgi:hypothetical protein